MVTPTVDHRDAKAHTRPEEPAPKARDFKFLNLVDPKSSSRAPVLLLAEYAANAAHFFHDRHDRYSVECLVNARKFAEYMVIYVEKKEGVVAVGLAEQGERDTFADRLDNLKRAVPDLPHHALKRIWRDAGDAVHPPRGTSEQEIKQYKHAYQVRAQGALKDTLAIGRWFEKRYKTLSWFARLKSFLRGNQPR
jgi:hypothetical protein